MGSIHSHFCSFVISYITLDYFSVMLLQLKVAHRVDWQLVTLADEVVLLQWTGLLVGQHFGFIDGWALRHWHITTASLHEPLVEGDPLYLAIAIYIEVLDLIVTSHVLRAQLLNLFRDLLDALVINMLRFKLYRLYGVAVFDDDVVFGLYLTIFFVDRLIDREELLPLEIALLLERVLLALAVLRSIVCVLIDTSLVRTL